MEPIPESDYEAWDRFVAAHAQGTLFHTAWWHRAWGAPLTVLARRSAAGEIEAGLALHVDRFLMTSAVRRPPLTPANGPLVAPCAKESRSARHSHQIKELGAVLGALPRLGFYDFVLREEPAEVMPFLWNGFETYIGYTYVIPPEDSEAWAGAMSEQNKRNLKKARAEAEEAAYRIEVDPPFEQVRPLLLETADSKGFAYAARYVEKLPAWWEAVRRHDAGRCYAVVDTGGAPVCATLLVWDARHAYYLAGGMRRELRQSSHVNLLLFERMIGDAHAMGRTFDFEGSVLPGVERFFRGWGGRLRQTVRLVKIPSPAAWAAWQLRRYWHGHRLRTWVMGGS